MDFVVELIDEIFLKLQFLIIYRYCIENNFVHDFTHPYNFGFKVLIMFSIDNISKSIFRHKFECTNKVITSLLNYILSIWYSLSKTYHFQKVLKAHVTSTGSKYANDLYDGISMKAEEEFLHISRDSSDGKYINNSFMLPLSIFILNF